MWRDVVVKPPAVDARSAMWIRVNVLSRTPSDRPGRKWQGPNLGEDPFALIDVCACQWGPCGWCQDLNRHDMCAHRRQTSPASDGHETRIVSSRHGSALTRVWVKQVLDGVWQGCRWVCPCLQCERIGRPLLPQAVTDALPKPRRQRGPLAQQPLF